MRLNSKDVLCMDKAHLSPPHKMPSPVHLLPAPPESEAYRAERRRNTGYCLVISDSSYNFEARLKSFHELCMNVCMLRVVSHNSVIHFRAFLHGNTKYSENC